MHQLEEKFFLGSLDKDQFSLLLQFLKKIIEFFRLRNDPVLDYFKEKLQFFLLRQNRDRNRSNSSNRNSIGTQETLRTEPQRSFREFKPSVLAFEAPDVEKIMIEYNTKKREMEIITKNKIQAIIAESNNKNGIEEIINNFQQQQNILEEVKSEELNKQQNIIQKKLEQRCKSIQASMRRGVKNGQSTPVLNHKFPSYISEKK